MLLSTPSGEVMTTCACCDLDKPVTVALHCHPETVLCLDCLDWLQRHRDKQVRSGGPVRVLNDESIFLVADVGRAKDHYLKLGFTTSGQRPATTTTRTRSLTATI